jgi:hypothetical protein
LPASSPEISKKDRAFGQASAEGPVYTISDQPGMVRCPPIVVRDPTHLSYVAERR